MVLRRSLNIDFYLFRFFFDWKESINNQKAHGIDVENTSLLDRCVHSRLATMTKSIINDLFFDRRFGANKALIF